MSNIDNLLVQFSSILETKLEELLPKRAELPEDSLFKTMRWALKQNGQRFHSFFVVSVATIFAVPINCAMRVAACLEILHAKSLLMNNILHIPYHDRHSAGFINAVLASDAMLVMVFNMLAHPDTHKDHAIRNALVGATAEAVGYGGLIGGQMLETVLVPEEATLPEIVRLKRMKTGSMFMLSVELGAILGKVSPSLRASLKSYASTVGIMYQILEDLKEASTSDNNTLRKATLINTMSHAEVKTHVDFMHGQALHCLDNFDERARTLRELVTFVQNECNKQYHFEL